VVALAELITLVAFVTPSISWREIRDVLRKWNQPASNETADLLGIQQKPVIGESAPTQRASLPRDHLLSGGFALSEEVVMTVRTGEFAPMEDIHIAVSVPRYYWRSIVYDNYVGAGWVSSSSSRQDYPPNTPLIPGLLDDYKPLHLEVEMSRPEGKLFWSGILFSADVPFTANWRVRPQSDLFVDQTALLQADLFAATSDATIYHAEAYVPRAVVSQMRIASTEYPDRIRTKYLQLPSTVPERVRQLSQDLTQTQPNAYEKAKAIEGYLRAYPYDLEVPAPPEGQDVADYFLFDLKRGYCDYYATAMVVLARASGIPARFVSGYSSGYYDAENARYVVREMNAHSWVEVYFPEIGWVEFEPTASQPEISRTLSEIELPADQPRDPFASELLLRFKLGRVANLMLPVILILVGLILYYIWIERWRYLRLAPGTAIEKIYRKLYRFGRSLAGERTKAETAYEFMQKLTYGMNTIGAGSRLAKLFHGAEHEIELLTELYQATLFAHTEIQKQHTRKAVNAWKRLRWRLLMARWSNSFNHVILSPSLVILSGAKNLSDERDSSVAEERSLRVT
jgi:transglutaminase-like putative cysteine protease